MHVRLCFQFKLVLEHVFSLEVTDFIFSPTNECSEYNETTRPPVPSNPFSFCTTLVSPYDSTMIPIPILQSWAPKDFCHSQINCESSELHLLKCASPCNLIQVALSPLGSDLALPNVKCVCACGIIVLFCFPLKFVLEHVFYLSCGFYLQHP